MKMASYDFGDKLLAYCHIYIPLIKEVTYFMVLHLFSPKTS
jgi:hypothetical protein